MLANLHSYTKLSPRRLCSPARIIIIFIVFDTSKLTTRAEHSSQWAKIGAKSAIKTFFCLNNLKKLFNFCAKNSSKIPYTGCPNKFQITLFRSFSENLKSARNQNFEIFCQKKNRQIEVRSALLSQNVSKLSRVFSLFVTFSDFFAKI